MEGLAHWLGNKSPRAVELADKLPIRYGSCPPTLHSNAALTLVPSRSLLHIVDRPVNYLVLQTDYKPL